MMSPTVVLMILMFVKAERHRSSQQLPFFRICLFFLGYVVLWGVFSAVIALTQIGLHSAELLSPTMTSTSPWLSGGILIATDLFQFTPLKLACLKQCRSPVNYLMTKWRDGRFGALRMGLLHGVHCVGCCWALMALLFVAGVMNLFWMAALTAFVLIEKQSAGERFSAA